MPTYTNAASRIQCRHCKGEGTVPLQDRLSRTLALFSTHKRLQAAEVWTLLDERHAKTKKHVTIEAMNGRLEILRRMGLLVRERHANAYLYSLPSPNDTPSKRTVPAKRARATSDRRGSRAPRRAKQSRTVAAKAGH